MTLTRALGLLALLACATSVLGVPQLSEEQLNYAEQDSVLSKEHLKALHALKDLHELGFLTRDEFDQRRHALIDEITSSKVTVEQPGDVGTEHLPYNSTINFLLSQLKRGLPRSYNDILPSGASFWLTPAYLDKGAFAPGVGHVPLDSMIAVQERTLTRYGLNLYDGATWQIALGLAGLKEVSDIYERGVLYTSSTGANPVVGGIISIRANKNSFKYGAKKVAGDALDQVTLPDNATYVPPLPNGSPSPTAVHKIQGAYFYRMIGPDYKMEDPLNGFYGPTWKTPYPNNDTTTPWNNFGEVHFNDWKPITGENVWAAFTGPLQSMWIGNCSGIYDKKNKTDDFEAQPKDTSCLRDFMTFDEAPGPVQLALSILPALKALQSPLGSMYHCPEGTEMFPADENEATNVSNENNVSAYAAFKMLQQILFAKTKGTTDKVLLAAKTDISDLIKGLEGWFKQYLLPPKGEKDEPRVVYQGGHVSFDGKYEPVKINDVQGFAVDCQTWGAAVIGQKLLDDSYGDGTAYNMWQEAKAHAGYYDETGKLGGVGYTQEKNGTAVWSAEWTFGAILMTRKLAAEYKAAGNAQYASALQADADSMWELVRKPVKVCPNTDEWCGGGLQQRDGGYMYANARFFIPWGWYANPVSALCSTAWEVMLVNNFNPFIFGGDLTTSFLPDPTQEELDEHYLMHARVMLGRAH
eukprot:CAMPEP_0197848330 /NCGR_PEP_ID=MMETSP1438-20131217/8321_1 /TAXON_ID=1461541 /ORGANISM="Pterosperma sp., Strain CCMP1384" /LENGTH=694 /DNA_ID=CAMNT_0043460511 /DNA_START=88 /DNA_END=2172 /DNA_ORIENTATION=+